jgi:hypothetical protein
MVKKSAFAVAFVLALSSVGFATAATAATVKNGASCPKLNATTIVSVKGVKNTYICRVNPAAAANPNIAKSGRTWTLKTCVSYYAQYQTAFDNLKAQLDMINLLSGQDKTDAMKGYNDGMTSLNHTLAVIENNYCKTGL